VAKLIIAAVFIPIILGTLLFVFKRKIKRGLILYVLFSVVLSAGLALIASFFHQGDTVTLFVLANILSVGFNIDKLGLFFTVFSPRFGYASRCML
jgi:NADH:ubiquinone oxidoreductase subunit 5 (subunit L)/multisubunit Na+/H+ antiporter MnhA subunit